ncbi:MAG: hypothetical protein ACXWQO_11115 [Bdellovibrionota bacterium]
MKYLILALLITSPAHAKLKCAEGEGYGVMDIKTETGCPSGIMIENVETSCVDKESPAFDSLKPGHKFEICSTSILDSSKTTWLTHVMSAAEVKTATREEFGAAVSDLNRKPGDENHGVLTTSGKQKLKSNASTSAGSASDAAKSHAAH